MSRAALWLLPWCALVRTGLSLEARVHSSVPTRAARAPEDRICVTSAVAIDFETTRVLDWVAYHNLIGVDCFVLYYDRNHLSLNNSYSRGVFEELSKSSIVTMVNSTYAERLGDESGSGATIHDVAELVGGLRYLAVIDVDEFIVTKNRVWLPDLLEELVGSENQLGLYLNRWSFGTNGHVRNVQVKDMPEFFYLTERTGTPGRKKPDKDEPRTGKIILNLASGVNLWGVHSWHTPEDRPDARMLMPDGTPLPVAKGIHFINRVKHIQPIWINHYQTGSLNQCLEKAELGDHHRSRWADCKKLHPGAKEYDASKMTQDRDLADAWGVLTRQHREELFPGSVKVFTR